MKRIPPSAAVYQVANYCQIHFGKRIHSLLILLIVVVTAAMSVKADDCPPDSNNGGQNISAQITIAGTGQVLSNGSFVAPYTSLRLDSAAAAYGNCTPMLADCSSSPCSCTPLQTYERTINHIKVWSEISTSQSLNGVYTEGYIYGWDENHTTTSYHELDSHSSLSTGPIFPFIPYAGTYTYHIIAYINGTPCNLEPYETQEIVITLQVADPADLGDGSCNTKVGNPINVTNGNMYIQQTDYRLPGIGEGLEITRTYNSQSPRDGIFGHGWTSNYEESLEPYGTLLLRLNLEDGRAVYLSRPNTSSVYVPAQPLDFRGQVVKNGDNTCTLTFKDGRVHQFSSAGKLLSQADRNGNTVTLTYDTNGFLSTVTDASGRVLTFTFGYWDMVSSVSDSLGTVATYTNYRGNAETVRYTDGSGFNFNTNYSIGKLASVSDVLGNVLESHTYDGQGRAITSQIAGNGTELYTLNYVSATETDVTDALNHVTKYFFDTSKGRGIVTSIEGTCSCGGSQVQSWTYDNQLNVTAKTDALNHTTTFTYDTNGNRLTQTDATGTITYTYNSLGEVLTVTDQMSGVWTNTYDSNGNLLTVEDPLNNTTTLTYDTHGQLLTVTDPRNNTTTFTYDTNGNLTRRTDALNNQTNIAYDTRGRVTSVTNALNQVTSYEYDLAGRLKKIIYPDTNFVLFTYDLAGRRTKIKDPRGYETNFAYDAAYRLTSETNADNKVTSYAYDLISNVIGVTDALNRTTNYSYDDFNRLKKITYPEASAGAGRLEENFTYDLAGNLLENKDQANRITSFCYDTVNRLTTVTDPALKVTSYEYNARSQLTAVIDQANKSGGVTVTYSYDALGRRIQRTSSVSGSTKFVYDGGDVVRDLDSVGTTVAEYLNTIGIDSKLRQTASGTISYFITDHLATTRSLVDSTGDAVGVFDYDSFGKINSGSMQTRYSYTGRESDGDTDIVYYRARWYSPQQGRFISEDPIGFRGGDVNLYGYVWRSPLNFRDPLGLDGWGNDAADWLDERIEYARQYWRYCEEERFANSVNNAVADFAFGISDLLRVGSGLGRALYAEDENGYGRAASVAQDIVRATAIFSLLAAPAAKPITTSNSTECCISTRSITDPGRLLPERAGPTANISPTEVMNKTPVEIDARAQQLGLQPRGPDPAMGRGAYIDPQTGTQRILSHPNATPPHAHVNNPAGNRIGPTGSVVRPNSPAAHLPIR